LPLRKLNNYSTGLELLEYKKQEKATALEKELLDLFASKIEESIEVFIEGLTIVCDRTFKRLRLDKE
jgi:hypothetical protein